MAKPDITIPGPQASELATGVRMVDEAVNDLQLLAQAAELLARLCRDHEEPDVNVVETLWAMSKNVLASAVAASALASEARFHLEKLVGPIEETV